MSTDASDETLLSIVDQNVSVRKIFSIPWDQRMTSLGSPLWHPFQNYRKTPYPQDLIRREHTYMHEYLWVILEDVCRSPYQTKKLFYKKTWQDCSEVSVLTRDIVDISRLIHLWGRHSLIQMGIGSFSEVSWKKGVNEGNRLPNLVALSITREGPHFTAKGQHLLRDFIYFTIFPTVEE